MCQSLGVPPLVVGVAGHRERGHPTKVERYAQGEFLTDLIKGQADQQATTRLADKVAALTGIDQAVSRRLALRVSARPCSDCAGRAGTTRLELVVKAR